VRRAQFQLASPDYFATLRSPILSGRAFTAGDTVGSEPVVIVNETLAKTQSPGKDAVGRSISLGRQSARIVGVVADIHDDGLDVPVSSRVYFPLFQRSNNALTVFYRSANDPASLNTEIERAIHAVDSTLPVFGQSTMKDLLADSMVRRKVVLSLMAAFAGVALLLAAIGTYGVMSVAANQRVREIGIRMALGAQRRDIERLIVRPGLVLAAAGVAAGVSAAVRAVVRASCSRSIRPRADLRLGLGAADRRDPCRPLRTRAAGHQQGSAIALRTGVVTPIRQSAVRQWLSRCLPSHVLLLAQNCTAIVNVAN
jgi:putative ABC transport system permease protein